MKAGEIWEFETNNGYTKEVVILAPHDGYCTVLMLTDYDDGYPVISRGQKYTDVGRMSYCFNDTFTKFIKVMPDKAFEDLMAEVAKALGIEQKTVEVPVEKIVEVPAPGAIQIPSVEFFSEELATARAEAGIYKDLYEKLLAKMIG